MLAVFADFVPGVMNTLVMVIYGSCGSNVNGNDSGGHI
jgi:hypothetical protein